MNRVILFLFVAPVASGVFASEYICRNDGLTRMIGVEYQADPEPLPCRVRYDKPQEGGVMYPWNAQNEVGFCERKAAELADRLTSFGWSCERQEPETGAPESG